MTKLELALEIFLQMKDGDYVRTDLEIEPISLYFTCSAFPAPYTGHKDFSYFLIQF